MALVAQADDTCHTEEEPNNQSTLGESYSAQEDGQEYQYKKGTQTDHSQSIAVHVPHNTLPQNEAPMAILWASHAARSKPGLASMLLLCVLQCCAFPTHLY